ncbi:MAG: hypothetical protein WA736_00690 [Candidatus Acidiferrum sp.]
MNSPRASVNRSEAEVKLRLLIVHDRRRAVRVGGYFPLFSSAARIG